MGKRGPPAKPTKLKKLEGTFRPDRAVANELELTPGIPERPDWLDAEGKREWDRVVPQLAAKGILCDVDQGMLANYCAALSLAVKATKAYQKQGLTVKTPFGPQKNPMIKVAQEARAQAKQLEDKTENFLFGTPKLVVSNDGK
jgi:P27 family predicted phage terminase small subunit